MIYHECWGLSKAYDQNGIHNGYAIGCGTGIENCNTPMSNVRFWFYSNLILFMKLYLSYFTV